MTDIPRTSIVLTHNRPELVRQCVKALLRETHDGPLVLIDNASDPPLSMEAAPIVSLYIADQPPNLSRLWNIGLEIIWGMKLAPGPYDVAIVCDDVIVPEGWYDAVSSCMRANGAAAGSTHQWHSVSTPILKTAPDTDLANRMCGWAFVLAGEKNLRADEELKWWWCDTELDWQARVNGGMVICPGPVAHNIHPNDFTYRVPGLAEQSGQDGLTFARKHGSRPW